MFPEWVLVIPLVFWDYDGKEISTAGNIVFESRFENFDDCHTCKELKRSELFEAMVQYDVNISDHKTDAKSKHLSSLQASFSRSVCLPAKASN